MWEIEKIVKKGKYLYAVVRNHPRRIRNDYVLYHRVLMENHLNRLLDVDEHVHHKDGNTHNNDISNLEVMNGIAHRRLHGMAHGRKMTILRCPQCGTEFHRASNQVLNKGLKAAFVVGLVMVNFTSGVKYSD